MNKTNTLLILGTCLTVAQLSSVEAATFVYDNRIWDQTGFTNVTGETSVLTRTNGGNGVFTFSYVVTNVDIDGVGGANDGFTYSFTLTGNRGANVANGTRPRANDNRIGVQGGGGNSRVDFNEGLTFSAVSVSDVNFGGVATTDFDFTFNGYTGITLTSVRGGALTSYEIDGATETGTLEDADITFTAAQTFAIDNVGNGSVEDGDFRVLNGTFSLDITSTIPIPEPSSVLMVGAGSIFLTLRRRRERKAV